MANQTGMPTSSCTTGVRTTSRLKWNRLKIYGPVSERFDSPALGHGLREVRFKRTLPKLSSSETKPNRPGRCADAASASTMAPESSKDRS